MAINEDPFDKVNRFIFGLALLIILILGVTKIILPEVIEIKRVVFGQEAQDNDKDKH